MNLENFIEMMQKNLEAFKLYWITENAKNPVNFPLNFDKDNDGVWFEMFEIFMSEKGL